MQPASAATWTSQARVSHLHGEKCKAPASPVGPGPRAPTFQTRKAGEHLLSFWASVSPSER